MFNVKKICNSALGQVSNKEFFFWFLIAFALRLIFLFATAHSDLIFVHYSPTKLATEGVFDIYRNSNPFSIYYPPLTYFFFGGYQLASLPFNSNFFNWIQNVHNVGLREWLIQNGTSINFFKQIFFMKFPFFIFDVLCLVIILKYLKEAYHKKRALRLWSINPVILYGVYGFGQTDILPAFFAILSLLLLKYSKQWWGFFCLSIAALFKTFTIFMMLPFLIFLTKSKKDLFNKLLALAIPFLVIFLPLFISSKGKILYAIFFDPGVKLTPFLDFFQKTIICFLFLVLFYGAYKLRNDKKQDDCLLNLSIASIMVLYGSVFIPVHYFVWVMPFLIIAVSKETIPLNVYLFLVTLLFLYNLNSPNTTSWLFLPINPEFFSNFPGLPDLMHKFHIKWGGVMLISRLLFKISCILIAMELVGQSSLIKRLFKIKIG